MKKALLLMVFLLAFLFACKERITESKPAPPAPRFVASAADTAASESGIDAVPEEDAIFLQWHLDGALAGYQLHRRRDGEKIFALIAALTARDSSFIDRVALNTRYFYYLRGVDDEERVSAPSDTADYMLIAKAGSLIVTPGDSLEFSWSIGMIRPAAYVLRLEEESGAKPVWISLIEPRFQGARESTRYNRDGRAKLAQLQRGTRYRWRLDCVGSAPRSGSESVWQRFSLF